MVWYGPWQPGIVITLRVGLQGNFIGVLGTPARGVTDSPTDGIASTEPSRHQAGPHDVEGFAGSVPPFMGSPEVSEVAWEQMLAAPFGTEAGPPHLAYETSLIAPGSGYTVWDHRAGAYVTTWDKEATLVPAPTLAEQEAAGAISWQPASRPLVPESEVLPPEIIGAVLHWPEGPLTPNDWLMVFRDVENPPPLAASGYVGLPPVEHGADLTAAYLALQDTPGTPSFGFHFVHALVHEGAWPGWSGDLGTEHQGNAGSPEIHLTLRGRPWRWVFPGEEPEPEVPVVSYRRTFPRHDSLAGGAARTYPPSRAVQTSNRIGGGYL